MERTTSSLEEEGKLLQEALSEELNRFTDVIARARDSAKRGPLWDLLIAVTQGNVEAVKALLPKQDAVTSCWSEGSSWQAVDKFGWTPFHLAAVNGDCAVLACLKE
ncbi:unnamed protein product, partial [Symbiodinium sp. KB8]